MDGQQPLSQPVAQDEDVAPPGATSAMDADQLAESKLYSRRKLYCTLADMALDVTILAVLATVVARPLDDRLAGIELLSWAWLRLGVFFLIAMALQMIVTLPLAFYSGFVLEHQFQLSNESLARWSGHYALRHLLSLALGIVLVEGLFWVIWLSGPVWWLIAAAGSFVVSVVLGQLMPVLILPLFYSVQRLEDEALAERIGRLLEGTTLTLEGIYRIKLSDETVKANAMLAGLGRTRRVILGDTLLDGFTEDEIEVVLAHEVGHHVFRHIPKLIVAGFMFSTVSFFVCDRLLRIYLATSEGGFRYDQTPVAALPTIMLILTVFSLILVPVRNLVSRYFERQCDRYALERTGLREAYCSAFQKLARINKADPHPHPLETFLFHDHPPIAERLALADRQNGSPVAS